MFSILWQWYGSQPKNGQLFLVEKKLALDLQKIRFMFGKINGNEYSLFFQKTR